MKNFLLLTICVLSLSLSAVCQVSKIYKSDLIDANVNRYLDHVPKDLFDISKTIESDGTIIIKDGVNVSISKLLTLVGCSGEEYTYKEERESKSLINKNTYHQFYQQYYKGVKVDGGSYLISVVKDGTSDRILKFSPHLYNDINLSTKPTISIKNLRSKFSKESKKISNSSLIISFKYEKKPKLIWDIIISNSEDNHLQIDANNGTIYKKELSAVGLTGDTRNYQNVTLNDFTSNGVTKLRTPSGNIKIYQGTNIGTGTHVNLPDWNQNLIPSTTSTTTWNGGSASTTAIQSLFVANVVVNKYLEKLNISFPNVNIAVQQYGAETLLGSSTENAYMIIGYLHQNTPPNGPNYALYDVIAHELGHSHFFQFLDYDDNFNNGALHEGLADVFGTYIENYIKPNGTDWINANDDPEVGAFINRNHAIKVCLSDGATEAHAIGKIVSHWFYSITQGIVEPGTNIPALGIETSMNIVREALNQLNFKKAGIEYFAYRTLDIVASQYGINSTQYEAVSKAWSRVCVTPLCANVPDITIISGQNITYTTSSTFSHVTIQSGGKLTLINNNFHVLANKVITVQNGGELLVSGSISSCGINETWKGIKIETGGRLNVITNLEISNAVNGIQADPNAIINIYGRLNIVGNSLSNTGISLTGNSSLIVGQVIDISNCKTGILLTGSEQIDFSNLKKNISNCLVGVSVQGGYVDLKNFEFDNCSRPIVLKNTISSCFITNNIIEGSFYTGIYVDECNDVIIDDNVIGSLTQRGFTGIQSYFSNVNIVGQNHIYTTGRCINSIESIVSVDQNYLDVSGVLSPKVKGCIISGTNKEGSQITNNFLVANGANYGIFSEYESKTFINYNDVKFKVPNGSRSAAIDVSGIIDGKVDGNIIDGDPWARGIQLQNTMGTAIQCNEVINANVSLNILHNSDNHTIKANTLTGTDDINIRSVIGPQPAQGDNHHGNKFEGGTVKAIGLSDDEIQDSRFRVLPSTPYLPLNRTPAIGWFIPESNKPMESCSSLQITPGPDWTPDPMRLCSYYTYLKSIKDSLPERFFINVFHLLKYEKLNPGFALPPCIKNDSTLAHLCGIKKLTEISFVLDTLGTHKSLTKDVRMLRDQYLKSNNPTTKHNLEQSIKSEWSSIYTKLPAAKLKDSLALDSLKGELNKLFCDSLVHKWKEIYKLYIDFKQHKRVLASDTTAIKAYSSECAPLYGDAIHLARVIASTFTDQDYTVYDDCIAVPTPRSKQGSLEYNIIMLYPNPSHGLVRVQLPINYLGQLTVSNSYGIVSTKRPIHNEEIIDLDLSSYLGVNILRFESIQGKINTIRVIILK